MAASAGAIRAGRAFVELFADNSKLKSGLRAASAKLKAFGSEVRAIGLQTFAAGSAAATALTGAGKYFANVGDDVAKAAKRTGMTAEAFSGLAYAADLSGASAEDLEGGIRKLQRTLSDAAGGGKSAKEALAALGLTAKDLMGLTPEKQIGVLADRLAGVRNPAVKAAAAMEIFGRGGTALLPLLDEGAAGIADLVAEAERLGLIVSSEDAARAEELNDAFDRMWKTIKRVAFDAGAALAPTLQRVAEWVTRAAVTTSQWVRANKGMIVTALKVAAAVAAVGAALVGIGTAIVAVGAVLGGFATVLGVVAAILKGIIVVIGAMLSPIGLVVTAVVALGVAILYWTGAGGKAIGWLGERFAALKNEVGRSMQGIADAIAAGDLALAAQIAWLTVKMEWFKGTKALRETWNTFVDWLAANSADWDAVWELYWLTVDDIATKIVKVVARMKYELAILANVLKDTGSRLRLVLYGPPLRRDANGKMIGRQSYAERESELDAAYDKAAAEAKTALDDANKQADQLSKERGDELSAKRIERDAAQKEAREKASAEAEEKLAKAEAELAAALAEAKNKRIDMELERFFGAGPEGSKRPGLPMEPVGPRLREAEVRGTFNAAGVLGLSVANTAQERTAKATEATATTTARMLREIEDGGAAFT